MADEFEDSDDDRAIELSAISAIYPELVIDPTNPFSASIDIAVEPVEPLAVSFPPHENEVSHMGLLTPSTSDDTENRITKEIIRPEPHGTNFGNHDRNFLSHLPPLNLKINLQEGYPSHKPPLFHLEIETPWIPAAKMEELRRVGSSIWEDMGRDQVVFSYIDYLKEAADRSFDLTLKDRICLEVSPDLKIGMLDFDRRVNRAKFEQETFECGVCLEPKKGVICHRLFACSHVFCVPCLQDFYNACITDGDISNVKCIAPNCNRDSTTEPPPESASRRMIKRRRKLDKTLEPSELLQIPLDQETVQRYIRMKRKIELESDPTTIYCPRQWCQGPARPNTSESPPDDDLDSFSDNEEPKVYDPNANEDSLPPPAQRLAICEDCTFAFCKVCKKGWHGEFFSCFPRRQFELTAEEKATEEYMKFNTTPCPTCSARCQKTMGCNHMICFKCGSHFCYLCSSWLDQNNPYGHFNTAKKPCYMRLWELEGGDGDDVGIGYAGGAAESDDEE